MIIKKFMQTKSFKNKGFTLIELLVVIAIIGLLATVALVSLSSARQKGRDAKAQADLKQISTAMEMFYDVNDVYVSASGDLICQGAGTGTNIPDSSTVLRPFLDTVPRDNGDRTNGRYFWCNGNASLNPGTTANFCVYVESDVTAGNFFWVSEKGSGIRTTANCP